MKATLSSAESERDRQQSGGNSHWIAWGIYLIVAATLFVLWFVRVDTMFSYLFGGWMMSGAILLWLIEDTTEY
jgi:hypothetical protein